MILYQNNTLASFSKTYCDLKIPYGFLVIGYR